jgi:hypothetical protein
MKLGLGCKSNECSRKERIQSKIRLNFIIVRDYKAALKMGIKVLHNYGTDRLTPLRK